MTDRDYFAAAALTRGMGVLGYDQIAKSCYEMADAMLRERGRTNHDAVPEAKAFPALWPEDEIAIEAAWERTGLKPTWPADEAGCGVKYANAMAQEIERLRQFDRLQPIEPADATPATHDAQTEGSVRRNCSVESRETVQQEPVAWAILHLEHQFVSLLREVAEARNVFDAPIVPLYSSPTLTDEERDCVRAAIRLLEHSTNSAADRAREGLLSIYRRFAEV